jgi:hypothetical protein
MHFHNLSLALLGTAIGPAVSFTPQVSCTRSPVQLNAKSNDLETTTKNALSGVALAAALWTAPATIAGQAAHFPSFENGVVSTSVASAKEMASGTGSRVNKDAESLLRYGLPIDNKEVRLLN